MLIACCAELDGATEDIARLQSLLSDAAETLLASFNAIDSLCRSGGETDAVSMHIQRAVTALQFQDLASQLIGHTRQRLGYVEENLRKLQGPREKNAKAGCAIDALAWKDVAHPVRQRAMDAGSVDLF